MRRAPHKPGALRAIRAIPAIFALAAASSAPSCSTPPLGELVIAIQTDLAMPKDIDALRVEIFVRGEAKYANDFTLGNAATAIKLPATLGLLPPENLADPVTIRVIARRGGLKGEVRVLREIVTTIPTDRVAMLPIPIEFLCIGSGKEESEGQVVTTCPDPEHTCVGGVCVAREIDSSTLPDYASEQIFGGASGPSGASCFDAVACLRESAYANIEPASCMLIPSGSDPINVALRSASEGICGAEGCFIPLDADSPTGFLKEGEGTNLRLPPAVCEQLASGVLLGVVTAPVTEACKQKTVSFPLCGPGAAGGPGSAASEPLWRLSAPMNEKRHFHVAARLPTGVLVAGGYDGTSSFLASAEVFSFATEAWTTTKPMSTPRMFATATVLANGHVLVAGGEIANGSLATAELYDPSGPLWAETLTPMSVARSGHVAALLNNGKVLVAGGSDEPSAEVYDPATYSSSPAGTTTAMPHRGSGATATVLKDGRVLVAGGCPTSMMNLASAELFNPATTTWTTTGSMAEPRCLHTATLLANEQVLVTGGAGASGALSSAELYDPQKGTWSPAAPMAHARFDQTATLLSSGKVLVTGDATRAEELYDWATNTWQPAGLMNANTRSWHTATLFTLDMKDAVLIAGGRDISTNTTASTEIFRCTSPDICGTSP